MALTFDYEENLPQMWHN